MNVKSKLALAGTALVAGLVVAGAGLAATPPKKTPEQKAEVMLQRFDANKDGIVTTDEVLARADTQFGKGDLNKDGRITREEIDTVMAKASEKKRDKLMKRYDLNNDGAITKNEVEERARRRFARFDTDKDGKVNVAEAAAAITAHRARKA